VSERRLSIGAFGYQTAGGPFRLVLEAGDPPGTGPLLR
jgi:hypothetical protein